MRPSVLFVALLFLGREPAEHGHLLGIRARSRARHLEDERKFGEPRLVEQSSKAFLADLPGSDVGVAVPVGTETGRRVVAVDDVDAP